MRPSAIAGSWAATAVAMVTGCGRRGREDAYRTPSNGQPPRIIAATGPVGYRYSVQRGDTLSSISVSGVSVQEIMAAATIFVRP